MAKLESTPQRVFYLINNFNNVQGNRSLWDMNVTRSEDDRTITTEYTEIVATKKSDDIDFTSVTVRATNVKEVTVSNPELGTIDRNLSRNDLEPTYWDSIDDGIVDIINNYYDMNESNMDLRERMINYADAISDFVEDNITISPEVDDKGIVSITMYGLPVDTTDVDESDEYDIVISSTPSLDDYEIDIRSDDSDMSFTIKELKKLIDKSVELDEILNYMKKYVI